jgi:hypothetical protein
MNYAVNLGLGAMIYVLSFVRIDLGIPKIFGEIHVQITRHMHTQTGR